MTATSPPPSDDRTDRRRVILAEATRLFAERGFRATTMQAVAHAAGVSVGYLYKHFDGKDAMLAAILDQHLERMDHRDPMMYRGESRPGGPVSHAPEQPGLRAACAMHDRDASGPDPASGPDLVHYGQRFPDREAARARRTIPREALHRSGEDVDRGDEIMSLRGQHRVESRLALADHE